MTSDTYTTRLNRLRYLEVTQDLPKPDLEYALDDCLPYADSKGIWGEQLPVALMSTEDKLLGLCIFVIRDFKSFRYLDIKRIFTVSNRRKQGYGKLLYSNVTNYAKTQNCEYIRMFCNPDSLPFYRSCNCRFLGKDNGGYSFVFQHLFRDVDVFSNTDTNEFVNQQINLYSGYIEFH